MTKKRDTSDTIVATLQDYLKEQSEDEILPEVLTKLKEIVSKTHKAREIIVTSAVPMREKDIASLQAMLKNIVRRDLPLVSRIEPALIGGFTVRIDDWYLDASIASQLTEMKRRLLA